jgi:hypothetical protein
LQGLSSARIFAYGDEAERFVGAGRSVDHFLFAGGIVAWPLAPCDNLYAEPPLFGLSDFGFLASLLPFI